MTHHYLDSNGQPAGPLTLPEIEALARAGKVPADPKVAPVGSTDWKALSEVPAAPAAGAAAEVGGRRRGGGFPVSSTVMADFVGGTIRHVSRVLSPGFLEGALGFSVRIGHWAVLVGAALGLVYAIVAAVKFETFTAFLLGSGMVAAIAVAQYAAVSFMAAGPKLIANSPSRISSVAFLECVGLLALLGGVAALILGLVAAIRMDSFGPLVPALFQAAVSLFVGVVALHPRTVAIEPGEGSAGEEAIGLISFAFKAALKLVPLFFLLFAVVGCVATVVGYFERPSSFGGSPLADMLPFRVPYGATGMAGVSLVMVACLLPLAAYFGFLVYYLTLDVLRAILSVPAKLDALRR